MKYSEYFSWITDENERRSPYQLLGYPFNVNSETLDRELQNNYFAIFFKAKPTECCNFLQYHFDNYKENKVDFIWFIENTFNQEYYISDISGVKNYDLGILKNSPIMKVVNEWIDEKRIELNIGMPKKDIGKIKWKGSPSVFGYLFFKLVHNGFIDFPPLYNGEINYTGIARLFFEHFDINNTTLGNLGKEINPGKNSLSETKKAKFTIPEISDLA